MPFASQKIREFRHKVGLTQAGLGAVLRVPQCTVARWETGFSVPSAEHIGLMCDFGYVQGVRPDFFFPNFNPIPAPPDTRNAAESELRNPAKREASLPAKPGAE